MAFARFAIGVTGGIGSGKSTVTALFEKLGVPVIDTDVLAHRLTAPGGAAIAAIRAAFGDSYVQADGALDRNRMRELVFADPAQRERLQQILHPQILHAAEREAMLAVGPYLMFAIPLLAESGHWRQRPQRVLVVDCSEVQQISRVMARSGLTQEAAAAILAAQASRSARLALADDVIDNSGDGSNLAQAVSALHQQYLRAAQDFTPH